MQRLTVVCLLLTVICIAQDVPKPSPNETLIVGVVELWLGMAEDAAVSKLTGTGYKLTPVGKVGDDYLVSLPSPYPNATPAQDLGVVGFTKGKLTFINRTWAQGETAAALGRGIYAALNQFVEEGRSACTVATGVTENQIAEIKTASLSCTPGRSHLEITIVREANGQESVSVEEILQDEPKSKR